MRLFRSKEHPDHWIGEDQHGALLLWPAEPKGWLRRTPYTGGKRQLEEVESALARGTGWPGGGYGPPPRAPSGKSSKTLGVRVTEDERRYWQRAAKVRDQGLSDWVRDSCNEAADRTLGEIGDARTRSKPKP